MDAGNLAMWIAVHLKREAAGGNTQVKRLVVTKDKGGRHAALFEAQFFANSRKNGILGVVTLGRSPSKQSFVVRDGIQVVLEHEMQAIQRQVGRLDA